MLQYEFLFFFVVLGGGTLWYLQKFLQYINYIILEFLPPFSFIAPPYICGKISTGIIFPFIQYSPSHTHSPPPPPSHWYQPSQAGHVLPSYSPILSKKKK
jgi:hypothetical protein